MRIALADYIRWQRRETLLEPFPEDAREGQRWHLGQSLGIRLASRPTTLREAGSKGSVRNRYRQYPYGRTAAQHAVERAHIFAQS